MENSEILQYYDDLMRLAASKCHVRADAEDLVGDVMLAAFAYMHGGGVIEHPKTWLTNTLYHKHNDQLRKKYRTPVTVCLDEALQLGEQETDAFLCSEEAANLRKELNHLAYVTREVLIRHYFGNQSVSQIAAELGVPEALQDFQYFGTGKVAAPDFPNRKDGGRWCAHATAIDAGYDLTEFNESTNYMIHGGHRDSAALEVGRAKWVRFCEFDTPLWDATHRFYGAYELYFKHIANLLWYIYDGTPLENTEIPNEFIAYMPKLKEFGLIGEKEGRPCLKIPVMKSTEYDEVHAAITWATEELKKTVGEDLAAFVYTLKTPLPKHLTSVPELFRYSDATNYLVMSIVREAYEKGLHLQGVDYCCPPVVLVFEE